MTDDHSNPLDAYIAAAATALSLDIAPEWLDAVRANLDVTLRFANMVAEFALPDEDEPASIYRA